MVTKKSDKVSAQIKALEAQLQILRDQEAKEAECVQRDALAQIAAKVAEAEKLLLECQHIADEAGVSFAWNSLGYGMGGWYESGEWQSSSSSC